MLVKLEVGVKVTLVRPALSNALSPILVTLLGIVMLVRLEQFLIE
jgi:hypothetical protein